MGRGIVWEGVQLRQTRSKTATEWPASIVELIGTWTDFPDLEEIRANLPEDFPREPL
jgi:hypothetical protein